MNEQQKVAHLAGCAIQAIDFDIGRYANTVAADIYEAIILHPEDFIGDDVTAVRELSRLVTTRELIIMWCELAVQEPALCVDGAIEGGEEFAHIYHSLSEQFLPKHLH